MQLTAVMEGKAGEEKARVQDKATRIWASRTRPNQDTLGARGSNMKTYENTFVVVVC